MSQKTEFDEWWNNTYLHTTEHYAALYRVFFKLHEAEADLDTIERLCRYLRLGDLFVNLILSERTKGKGKSLRLDLDDKELIEGLGEAFGVAFSEFLIPHLLHTCWSRGRKVDIWGSLFVLLVTEYMRSVRGKPRGRLADDLLRAVRIHLGVPLSTDIRGDGRNRVRDRIKTLQTRFEQERRGERTALNRYIAAEITKRRT